MKQTRCVLLFAVIIAAAAMGARADEPAAKTIARQLKFTKGLALDVGCGDGSLAIELTELTQLKFHGVEADPAAVDRARQRVVKAGLYGTRVTISRGELARPTYPERSANLIVFGDQLADGLRGRDLKGIYRLLNPNGAMVVGQGSAVAAKAASPLTKDQLVAWLKAAGIDHYEIVTTGGIWAVVLRGAEPGWDEWTHRGHDPANTYASADRLDLGKLKLQWAQPSQPGLASAGILVAGGRLIEVGRGYEGHADTTPYIQVSDAFNGTVLWSRVGAKELPIDRGLGEYSPIRACSDLAVAGEGLYVLAGKRCCVFDVATGKDKPAIPIPPEAGAGDADIWLYVAILGNRLYGSIGPSPKHHLKGFSGWGGPHWRGISTAVFSLDLATGKLRWARRGPAATASIVITGDRLLFLDDKQRVRGLSLADGKELFAVASGIPAEAKVTNVAAYRGRYWVMYADDGAVHSKARDLGWEMAVFSTADGKLQFRPDPGSAVASMSFSEGRAFMAPQHATGQIYAIHTDTGKVAQEMLPRPTGSKCTPVLATPDWLLYRHQAGSGFVRIDRASGDRHVYSRIRCTCHYPGLPAAGLLFVQGPGCNCAHPFRANVALAPGDRKRTQYKDPGQRLVTGPAAGKPAAGEASKGVWATWRADIRRSGRTAHDLPERLGVAWSVQPGRELTPPVLAEGMVFVGSTARKMIALDAATGKARWQFIADGPVAISPQWSAGRLYCSDDEGWAYCLRASDGELVWKFRAALGDERTIAYGDYVSAWPSGSGVLVHDGVAYCSGGFFPDEGGSIYALDAATGKVRWVKTDFFNRWPVDSIRGPMTMTGEVLFLPTVGGPPAGVHVNEPSRRTYHNLNWLGAFSPTGCVMAVEGEDRPEVVVSGSATLQFIHHATTYNDERRVLPIVTDTAIYLRDGRRLTADRREAYRVHKKNGVFTWSGGPRLQKARPSPKADDVLWKALKVIDPRCIIQAGGAVLTGTAGGRVYAHDATSGRELWVKEMGGPVADLAFAGGRLVVITDNGRIVCLSGP